MSNPLETLRLEFERIAESENIDFDLQKSVSAGYQAGSHSTIYFELAIPYKDEIIILSNMLGAQSYGRINLESESLKGDEFKLNTIDPLMALFTFKKGRTKVSCDNDLLKKSIEAYVQQSEIEKVVKSSAFSPYIFGKLQNDQYTIRTEYSLQFPDRHLALSPLIKFYKLCIDRLK